ncbi:MAG: alanine--glyoxylate aminotransferase family protein [Armatimonadetes bacterium]|nr:alanine--glyoxylate aminotransferase family protein [Armatimonadota bacterium]
MHRAKINMSCGQTDLYAGCLEEMGRQLGTPIYYPPYWEVETQTIRMLQELYGTKSDVLVMDGCATYGGEAALISALEPGEKGLFVITGVFGQVWYDVALCVGAGAVSLEVEPGDAVKPDQVEAALKADPSIKLVCVVQVETSMGTVNPVAEIGEVMRAFPDVIYMVDAVSSLGAMPVDVDGWGIDLCVSSPQKCINAPQGLALLSVSEKVWQKIEARKTPILSLCLDITVWRQFHHGIQATYEASKGEGVRDVAFAAGRKAKAAHGPSPSYVMMKALKASLDEIFEEGLENVFRRHRTASKAVRAAVTALGLGLKMKSEAVSAPVCTKIVWPEGLDVGKLALWMQETYGVAIGGDRIGNMGFVASPQYVLPTIHALEMGLREFGIPIRPGSGVEAACKVFAEEEKG